MQVIENSFCVGVLSVLSFFSFSLGGDNLVELAPPRLSGPAPHSTWIQAISPRRFLPL